MLGSENLWTVADRCNRALNDARLPYSICGGIAVCLHGYQRNTVDIDLVIRREDSDAIKSTLLAVGFSWDQQACECQTENGIAVQCLTAGDRAGKGSEVLIAEPTGDLNVEVIEGLPVIRLFRLIEMKIACGSSNLRRTHKDFADVVELIAIRKLDSAFARFLHKSTQPTFRQLVRNAMNSD